MRVLGIESINFDDGGQSMREDGSDFVSLPQLQSASFPALPPCARITAAAAEARENKEQRCNLRNNTITPTTEMAAE